MINIYIHHHNSNTNYCFLLSNTLTLLNKVSVFFCQMNSNTRYNSKCLNKYKNYCKTNFKIVFEARDIFYDIVMVIHYQ